MSPEALADAARSLLKAKDLRQVRAETDATGVGSWGLRLTGRIAVEFDEAVRLRDEINGAISSILGRLAAKYEKCAASLVKGEVDAFDARQSGQSAWLDGGN